MKQARDARIAEGATQAEARNPPHQMPIHVFRASISAAAETHGGGGSSSNGGGGGGGVGGGGGGGGGAGGGGGGAAAGGLELLQGEDPRTMMLSSLAVREMLLRVASEHVAASQDADGGGDGMPEVLIVIETEYHPAPQTARHKHDQGYTEDEDQSHNPPGQTGRSLGFSLKHDSRLYAPTTERLE